MGMRLFKASGLDVGAVEYLETTHGRRVFFDLNANSNLRRPIGEFFGFDPFERVAEFLITAIEESGNGASNPNTHGQEEVCVAPSP